MTTPNTGEQYVSPQMKRSIEATHRAIQKLHEEFGLLTIGEVAVLLGVSLAEARSFHDEGRIMAIIHEDEVLYPSFQFDDSGTVRPGIPDVISEAKSAGWSEYSLTLWMMLPTGFLDGKRPVDCLDHPDSILLAARGSFNIEW